MYSTKWTDEYSVGIDEIDDQHMVLVSCIGNLEQAIEHGDERQRWSVIHYALVQLADYTRVHFAVEESLMRILAYPDREAHIAQHRNFATSLLDFQRKSITQDVTESDIASFLRDWLLNHICTDDRKYADYYASFNGDHGRKLAC